MNVDDWHQINDQARKPKYQKKEPRKTRKRSSPQRPALPELCQPPPQRIPVVSRPVTQRSVKMMMVRVMMIRMISGMSSTTSPSSFHYLRSSNTFLRSTTQPPPCPLSTQAPLKMNQSPQSLWPQSSWASSRRLSRLLSRSLQQLTPLETLETLTLARAEVKVKETQGRGKSSWVSANNAVESENQQQTWLSLKFNAPTLLIWSQNKCKPISVQIGIEMSLTIQSRIYLSPFHYHRS